MSALAKIREAWHRYRHPWHESPNPAWFSDGLKGQEPRVDGQPEAPPRPSEYEAETDEQP
jgi:hypothetical protein